MNGLCVICEPEMSTEGRREGPHNDNEKVPFHLESKVEGLRKEKGELVLTYVE